MCTAAQRFIEDRRLSTSPLLT